MRLRQSSRESHESDGWRKRQAGDFAAAHLEQSMADLDIKLIGWMNLAVADLNAELKGKMNELGSENEISAG